jgi:iron complex outermembrane receptor protein
VWAQRTVSLGDVHVVAEYGDVFSMSVPEEKLQNHPEKSLTDILPSLPGVAVTQGGARNEALVYLRGFDLRQVPVSFDGIPIYVPYDGNLDLSRITAGSIGRLQMIYGIGSALNGPNDLGGRINVVSVRPEKTGGNLRLYTEFDDNSDKSMHRFDLTRTELGEKFYWRFHYNDTHQGFMSMPGSWPQGRVEDGDRRENSKSENSNIDIQLGRTGKSSEVTLFFSQMQGKKQVPLYAGSDPAAQLRYWDWPYYDKDRVYLLGQRDLSNGNWLKYRVFYDTFKNSLYSYDDITMTSQNRPFAFQSAYDDYASGLSLEYGFNVRSDSSWAVAFHLKDDVHRENDELRNPTQPWETVKDRIMSFGLERKWSRDLQWNFTAGLRYDHQENKRAEEAPAGTIQSFVGMENQNSMNPVLAAEYLQNEKNTWFAGFARKSRFSSMKDRFSYRFGRFLPNPALEPDRSNNYELGLKRRVNEKLSYTVRSFLYDIDDLMAPVPVAPGVSQNRNVGDARRKGIEFSVVREIDKGRVSLDYAYLDQDFATGSVAPRHSINLALDRDLSDKTGVELELMSSAASDVYDLSTATTTRIGSFSLINIGFKHKMTEQLDLQFGARNIGDEIVETTRGFPWAGRTFYVGATWKF